MSLNLLQRFQGRTGYQIFVDRFCREGRSPKPINGRFLKNWNDETINWEPDEDGEYRNQYFYGGNLKGIISKLDYLSNLGINLIYLSPISKTVSSHHYDVEDQRILDPWIGTWKDFKNLCEMAHKRDILICVDLVFNHMGSNSKFFKEALNSKKSKYRKWFEWDEEGKPVYWFGFKDMPQCDKLNENYQEYTFKVAEKYIREGADGIRLDLGENFPAEYLQKFREYVKNINPKTLIVSEMWEIAITKENPQIFGDQVDSVMNYPMADAICRWVRFGNEKHYEYTYKEIEKYPERVQNVLWNFIDSHDTPRALNMLAGDKMNSDCFSGRIWDIEAPWRDEGKFDTYGFRKWESENNHLDLKLAKHRLKLASLMQFVIPGIPIIYYGTENGITGYKDPFNRKPLQWYDKNDLIEHYKNLGIFRNNNKDILSSGIIHQEEITENTLFCTRISKKGILFIVVNRSENEQENPIKNIEQNKLKKVFELEVNTDNILKPYGAIVYRLDSIK